jgi:hypothetical protein
MTPSAIAPQSRREERRAASPELSPGEWLSASEHAESSANPDWRQIVSAIDARIAGFEARVEQAAAEFEAGALASLQQSFGEAIGQAQERIKRYSVACVESRLVGLEAEIEQKMAPFLTRSQTAISDLERLLESLRQEQAAWEAEMAQWHQQDRVQHLQDPVDLRLQRLSESLRQERQRA